MATGPNLECRLTVSPTSPLFQIIINDGGADGGSAATLYVSGDPMIPADTMTAAVQAFATALAPPPCSVDSVTSVTSAATSV